ncbi:hypothetical protein DS745_09390 [Anaerobacillus alkaliphilus]|uniref:SbsA Ig-like domain-containing protein n=1 Tax=Anaerobacillus alkaliphilus TaxID=1548597 RepID=A0A4Q0VSZ9_9BACI|nr:Ig-like domain-containing protein [Anaerobacillus alkaliphilus]RXJ01682.1 hypothetical protein DS745_09390 [Anaerobacillus alkaliphilus]
MMNLGDIRKGCILLFCLLLLPFNVQVYTSVVFGEGEATQQNNEDDIKGIDQSLEVNLSIIEPSTGSSFNVSEVLLSIETSGEEIQETSIVIFQGENEVDRVEAEVGNVVVLPISSYGEGNYKLQALLLQTNGESYYSNIIEFEIDRTAPEIEILTPNTQFVNNALVNGKTEAEIEVSLVVGDDVLTTISNFEGEFSFDLNEYVEDGNGYGVMVVAHDVAGNKAEAEVTFVIDKKRPFISPRVFPRPNMTQAPVGTVISVEIFDNNPILAENIPTNAIEVFEDGATDPLRGFVTYNDEEGHILFTPEENLKPSKKYFVFVNHMITDQAGNLLHARNWTFTTKSNAHFENPHGNYQANTNTCKTCHNVHVASESSMIEPSDELKETLNKLTEPVTSYCMACHDGTVASKMPEMSGHSNHNNKELKLPDVQFQSCGSCHDVHLGWQESNPNLVRDHFVFDHSEVEEAKDIGIIDSSSQLCESCHENDSLVRKLDERVVYRTFTYSNWNNNEEDLREGEISFGKEEDYTLCFSCHNSEVQRTNPKVRDVKSLYANTYESSGHFIPNDRIEDGSLLDGHMPCADCHETHGASNIKLLKETFGHNPKNIETKFIQQIPWTTTSQRIDYERRVCLSCHNNSTEMYGIKVAYPATNVEGEVIEGHTLRATSCVTCHRGATNSFFSTVHAPFRQGK